MPVMEDVVLECKDSSIENWDDWPTFSLSKIKIYSQATGELMSLLRAHKDNPMNVIGHLEPVDPEQYHLVRNQKYRAKAIELTSVTTYAFAEFNDGSYGFWAAGKAGWFEIKDPSIAFQRTYNLMNEAASMFYMLADKMRRSRKSFLNPTTMKLEKYVKRIFRDYLSQGKNYLHRVDEDEVCEGFHEHSEFLITSMLEGQEGLDWGNSPIFQYYKHKFPAQFMEIQQRLYPTTTTTKVYQARPEEKFAHRAALEEIVVPKKYEGAKRGRKPKSGMQAQPKTPDRPGIDLENDMDTSGDEPEIGDGEISKANHRKRKSILQPTGSKFSRKAAGRRKSLTFVDKPRDIEEGDIDRVFETQETSPLPPASHRLPKSSEHAHADQPPLNAMPSTYHKYPLRKYLGFKVAEYDLPSLQPQGPGDLWTCAFEGCGHRVYETSTPAGKIRVKEHFQAHAHQAQEKIDLAYKESRPYLPVDHLIRRIQSLAPHPDKLEAQAIPERPISLRARY